MRGARWSLRRDVAGNLDGLNELIDARIECADLFLKIHA
jgi:hypothetical protein